jgi:putative addiction module killer protein
LDVAYPYRYTLRVNTFFRTPEFDAWLRALRDPVGKARIIARVRSAEAGNFGDSESVGDGVFEMRVHV